MRTDESASTDGSAGRTAPGRAEGARGTEAAALSQMAAALKRAYPSVEEVVVDAAVAAAHGVFREAKIRTYVPILVERRARTMLDEGGPS